MKATVTRAENGYIIQPHKDEFDDAVGESSPTVVEETGPYGDDKLREARAAQSMLYTLLDSVGYSDSKHSSHRLKINVVDQDGNIVED